MPAFSFGLAFFPLKCATQMVALSKNILRSTGNACWARITFIRAITLLACGRCLMERMGCTRAMVLDLTETAPEAKATSMLRSDLQVTSRMEPVGCNWLCFVDTTQVRAIGLVATLSGKLAV